MFLPGFVLGVASCWHKNMLKTIVAHPSVVLMPTFTHFTFESKTMWSGDSEQTFITFSSKFTLANIILSVVSSVVYGMSMTHMAGWEEIYAAIPRYLSYYLHNPCLNFPWILLPVLGLLLTFFSLLFISHISHIHPAFKYTLANLVLNTAAYLVFRIILSVANVGVLQPPWDQHIYFLPFPILGLLVTILKVILKHYCNYDLFACLSLPRVEYGALVCSSLQAHYVLDADGMPERVIEEEEEEVDDQNVVLEMVRNREAEVVDSPDEMTAG